MTSSLSNLLNNLAERIHKIKFKYEHYDKNCKTCRIKYKDHKRFLNTETLKLSIILILIYNFNNLIKYNKMVKIKNHHILSIGMQINLYRCAMSQKIPLNDFKWVEETSRFTKGFIKNYNDDSNERHFLKLMFLKICITFTMI